MLKEFKGNSKRGGVYQIKNLINNKVYIGSAKCFQVRSSQHLYSLRNNKHQNKHLQASFAKHGEDAFLFEVLEVVEGDKLARTTKEKQFFEKYSNSWEMCYNFNKNPLSSERSCWSKSPEETKKKISKAMKKRMADANIKEKYSKMAKKLWTCPEYKKNHSEKMKKIWSDKSYKDKISKKNSAKAKEQWNNPEKRAIICKSIKKAAKEKIGKSWGKHTDEHKQKMSKLMKKLTKENSWNKGRKLPEELKKIHRANLLKQKHSSKRLKNLRKKLGKPIIVWNNARPDVQYKFETIRAAAKFTCVNVNTISRNVKGKQKSRTGWNFELAN